ncbi:MAG: GAF domain-containing protein [Anaerolineae bacterium]|nr:GAF domain-containing protein [Anaerolineae bacterium]
MTNALPIYVLATIPRESLTRFRDLFAREPQISPVFVTRQQEAMEHLADPQTRTDVLVLDARSGDTFDFVRQLRHTYPRLLIVLVDEEADFGLPGQADEISVTPFAGDDLLRRIKRLVEERRLETLRADTLPPVRQLAKVLVRARTPEAMIRAAVEVIHDLGYDYVAFFSPDPAAPGQLALRTQIGPPSLTGIAPQQQSQDGTLVGWVAQTGQSRTVGPTDRPNHPFIEGASLQSGVCVPVGAALRFGALLACRAQPHSIPQKHVMLLELISAQLATALAKRDRA